MLVREAHRIVARYPDSGVLPERLSEVERMTDASTVPVGLAATPLTPTEMRVLRYLPTHLSFEAIAEELIVSRNTVKTQAIAAYRKLGVTSRAEAVEHARGSACWTSRWLDRSPAGHKCRSDSTAGTRPARPARAILVARSPT